MSSPREGTKEMNHVGSNEESVSAASLDSLSADACSDAKQLRVLLWKVKSLVKPKPFQPSAAWNISVGNKGLKKEVKRIHWWKADVTGEHVEGQSGPWHEVKQKEVPVQSVERTHWKRSKPYQSIDLQESLCVTAYTLLTKLLCNSSRLRSVEQEKLLVISRQKNLEIGFISVTHSAITAVGHQQIDFRRKRGVLGRKRTFKILQTNVVTSRQTSVCGWQEVSARTRSFFCFCEYDAPI